MLNAKYLLPLALLSTSVFAADADKPFAAEAEFGAIITSGNSKSTAASGRLDIKQNLTSWRTNYIIGALYNKADVILEDGTTDEGQVTAQRFYMSGRGDYKLNEEYKGLFISGMYEEDEFSDYVYQASIAAGYSDRIFQSDDSSLDYSVGPGYAFYETREYLDENGLLNEAESSSTAILHLSFIFEHRFSENAKFTQLLASDIALKSEGNSRTRSESALTAKINSDFALKASYLVFHNSETKPGTKATDSTMALTIVYSF